MSRHPHTAGATMPAPLHPSASETVLVIVLVLTGAWLAPAGMEPAAILQLLGGTGLLGATVATVLRRIRRTPLTLIAA
ncbi:hypothetical protein AB0929_28305 [Streptomyces massasporeus]|uniref:hypothetical protein n=1 Tax=Streptomyces massasporeus TaxID=67324 RepID=UPI00345374A1